MEKAIRSESHTSEKNIFYIHQETAKQKFELEVLEISELGEKLFVTVHGALLEM